MEHWNEVRTPEDIAELMKAFVGFHDACLTELRYASGAFVDGEGRMWFGRPEERTARATFHSQWKEQALELCFTGVRKICMAGWQERYGCDLFDCYLAIHTDLVAGRDDPLIVWADGEDFSPKDLPERGLLGEPMDSYIVAARLRWRWTEKRAIEDRDCPEGGEGEV